MGNQPAFVVEQIAAFAANKSFVEPEFAEQICQVRIDAPGKRMRLFPLDAIANAVPEAYRQRIVARFDPPTAEPFWALGYRFDFVLRGRNATPMEH